MTTTERSSTASRSRLGHVWGFALAGLLVCACGKSDEQPEGAPSGERTKEPTPEVPKDAPTGPFAAFDFEAAEASWQGSWVLDGEGGKQVAWMIDGASLVEFDGTAERKLEFSLYSPCQVTYTDVDEGVTVYKSFTFVRDTLHAGLGSAGTVAGDSVIVCDGGKTYVLDAAGKCMAWTERFDDWKSAPATCSLAGEGETRKFVVDGREIAFIDDVAIGTTQMRNNVATKHANFAAAKAALASPAEPAPADAP